MFSNRVTSYLSDPSVPVSPWSPQALAAFEAEQGALPAVHRELEQALFEATGSRGLPVIAGVAYGIIEAHRRAPRGTPLSIDPEGSSKSTLLAWSASSGAGLYVSTDGLVDPRGDRLARDAYAFIGRQVVESSRRWSAVSVLVESACGEEIAASLGVPLVVPSDDIYERAWEGGGYFIADVANDAFWTRVRLADLSALKRLLARCSEAGRSLRLESSAPGTSADGGGEPSAELERKSDYRADGAVTVLALAEPPAAIEAWVHGGIVLQHKTLTEEATRVRSLRASTALSGRVSPRAAAYLESSGALRDPSRSCDRPTLARALETHGITGAPEALFRLEAAFGGLLLPNERALTRRPLLTLGVYQVISADPATVQELKLEGGESDVLSPDAWPRARWRSRGLYLVGDERHEALLYVDEDGVVYRFVYELDELRTAAGSARGFIEQLAFAWEVHRRFPQGSTAVIDADIGRALSRELDLPPSTDASDAVVACWLGDELAVRAWAEFGPTSAKAEVVAKTPEVLGRAVASARALAPDARVRVRG